LAEVSTFKRAGKKPSKPTVRELTTPLLTLRALQVGLRLDELEDIEVGELIDILTESGNDSYEYPRRATQEDFDKYF